ncbi:hypothetical protein E4U61_000379 [Claviceps capensis]|nr:hypothetical protein E4U61_000379 [Claviceps capensis]
MKPELISVQERRTLRRHWPPLQVNEPRTYVQDGRIDIRPTAASEAFDRAKGTQDPPWQVAVRSSEDVPTKSIKDGHGLGVCKIQTDFVCRFKSGAHLIKRQFKETRISAHYAREHIDRNRPKNGRENLSLAEEKSHQLRYRSITNIKVRRRAVTRRKSTETTCSRR